MNYRFLNNINSPSDVKKLEYDELNVLCDEVRDCLINTVSKNGGHLASNLGTVELTVALHKVFDSPHDSILFDVGHQCYTHKLLTGRFNRFDSIRTENGLSGFMRPDESEHDPFVTGHSSNSISASYGIYKAKTLSGEGGYAVTVIGDGAMTGGMVYEALNNSGSGHRNFIVILNDNKMSISRNVGSLAKHLTVMRSKKSYHKFKNGIKLFLEKIPLVGRFLSDKLFKSKTMIKNAIYKSNLFESMGYNYFGPVDGHNIEALVNILNIAKNETRPVLIHALTVKGKGYTFAENSPQNYHGVSSFDVEQGAEFGNVKTFSDVCGDTLCKMAAEDSKVCAITAAMTSGTGLTEFSKLYRKRFFDVGIAEEHAMTFSAGLAIKGMKPYFVVYSSFLQRAYDQIIHDVAVAKVPVRICIDRAGIVGEDGETHQGLFDVSFLSAVPNMTIYSPSNFAELEQIMLKSLSFDYPCAIRYPRGVQNEKNDYQFSDNDFDVFGSGDKLIITYGREFDNAFDALDELENTALIKLNKIYPLSDDLLNKVKGYKEIYFFEEGIKNGGIAEKLATRLVEQNSINKYKIIAIDNEFVSAASTKSAIKKYKLDTESIIKTVKGE